MAIKTNYKKRGSTLTLLVMLAALIALVVAIILWPVDATASRVEYPSQQDDIESTTLVKAGEMAPDFIVEMLDGSKVTLVENRGKVVLVSFWATWCPPCRLELSHMQKDVIDRFAGEDLVVLPISRGEERKTVESYISKMGYTFPVGLDTTQAIYSKYASNYVPRSVVIDREGMVVYVGVGYDEQIAKEIEQAIFEALQK
ncbi:MAG: TlpA family protein disulfide reductase [Alistipes sp.]|jgi:peroxiredoxin|nr:TlpA family protein disulfide reductase [Alistipes sp.]MBO5855120.1 TlpA family protein disulfide reductase [Alistipes sp.]